MFLPMIQANQNKRLRKTVFAGLDTRPNAPWQTLSEMHNMSPDGYPALQNRKLHKSVDTGGIIAALAVPEYDATAEYRFTGVKSGCFYYRGTAINNITLSPGEKSVADFNGKICIFPDKVFYEYLPNAETGQVVQALQSMEKSLSLRGVHFSGSRNELTGECTATLSLTGGGFNRFKPGESILIKGCSRAGNNVRAAEGRREYVADDEIISAVVESAESDRLSLALYTKNGARTAFTNATESGLITVKVSIPAMDHVCVHNNRLWGTSPDGAYIYASRLGDCMNFNSFQGLGDDSWYSVIGTPGNFAGICSYRSSVVAFKRDCIHHVYGSAPKNFAIPKQVFGGCIDGRSIAELDGVLYYLSAMGFMAYQGGEPYPVGEQLTRQYHACAAGSDGKYYYAAAYDDNDEADVLVYHPKRGLWYMEDNTPFVAFRNHHGTLYGATDSTVYAVDAGTRDSWWDFTTAAITPDSMVRAAANEVFLLLDKADYTDVAVSISYDGGDFIPCGELKQRKSMQAHRLPIRLRPCDSFRLRVEGVGPVVVHALEIITYQGGKTNAI